MNPNFDYEKKRIDYSSGYIFKGKHYRCSVIKYRTLYERALKGTETVEIYHFAPKEDIAGSILILHGLGSLNIPFLFWMGSHLASAGLQASILILPGNFTRTANGSMSGKDFFSTDLDRLITFWEHAVIDTRSTLDLLEQEGIWQKNNCVLGYCLGGMVSVIASAIEKERIKHTILMTVGGNMARIFWESPTVAFARRGFRSGEGEKGFLNKREELINTFDRNIEKLKGFSDVQELLSSDVHPLFKIDPLAYAQFIPSDKVTMIEALFDRALPKQSRKLLWKLLGKPKKYIVPVGHVTWLPFEYALGRYVLKKLGIKEARKQMRLLEPTKVDDTIDEENV
ncbi:alpha/beta hydrolase [Kosmotoga pacifica]|uniref:Alpha/beta hydrolase n=1 Tax=Kosmotoga pacifica TaxID=1330330 RepID=A0A0G2ZCF1_9BACT|nr:alpha/beta hydrolase [Kosmotoga pacifica]AKI97781.1 hypothetical protein IX53_08095 [Kosmotoga pacifica]